MNLSKFKTLGEKDAETFLDKLSNAYYSGKPIVTDEVFDELYDYHTITYPNSDYLDKVGTNKDNIKVKLPVYLGSLNKIKPETREFEKFIRLRIKKKFPNHQVIGEEFGYKKTKSDYTWVLDPIDGTRSFIIGNPTWSNLIALNYKGKPVIGLANYPKLNKYYLNYSDKVAYVFEKSKKRKDRCTRIISVMRRC